MAFTHKRFLIVIVVLIFTAVLTGMLEFEPDLQSGSAIQTIKKIPKEIGNWRGQDIILDETVFKLLETRSIIHRNYVSDGRSVFLSLVYYPETKVDFHAPEACLAGKGISIHKAKQNIHIDNDGKRKEILVKELIRRDGQYEELIYYLYKSGEFYGHSYIKLRFTLLFNKFLDRERSGSLIRISTPIIDGDTKVAADRLVVFFEKLYPFVNKYL